LLDPIDGAEWSRSWGIASYQQGKPNPFVVDCTLTERTYCAEFGQACTPVSTNEIESQINFTFEKIQPNPVRAEGAIFQYALSKNGEVRFEIFNAYGVKMEGAELGFQAAGEHEYFWENSKSLRSGMYFVRMIFSENGAVYSATQKMIVP
jgi:hypothetical protein